MKKQKSNRTRVGISVGDLNGIGLEVILKTFLDNRMFQGIIPVLYCGKKSFDYYKKQLKFHELQYTLTNSDDLKSKGINLVSCWEENVQINFGKATAEAGKAAITSLEKATKDLAGGKIDVLVTAPFNKASVSKSGFNFPGHTEYFANMAGTEDVLMFLVADELRVGLVTNHVPVKEIDKKISIDLICRKASLMNESLARDFGINKSKIAVLGLNPHAGDSGALGKEEQEIIIPAIKKLNQDHKVMAFGPYPSDGFFGSGNFKDFDAVLAMYHDQGLAPFKALTFDSGVNFTAGLPVVRTSPDHGTAYDIAGKGEASEQSFRNAIFLATDIYKNRINYRQLTSNPLPVKEDQKAEK